MENFDELYKQWIRECSDEYDLYLAEKESVKLEELRKKNGN